MISKFYFVAIYIIIIDRQIIIIKITQFSYNEFSEAYEKLNQ